MLGGTQRRSFAFDSNVENSGSTARDHLANERTFLAWARTGLGFLGAGTALFAAYFFQVAQDGRGGSTARARPPGGGGPYVDDPVEPPYVLEAFEDIVPACALLWTNGLLFLGYSIRRYFAVAAALEQGRFRIAKGSLVFVTGTTGLLTGLSLAIVYAVGKAGSRDAGDAADQVLRRLRTLRGVRAGESSAGGGAGLGDPRR